MNDVTIEVDKRQWRIEMNETPGGWGGTVRCMTMTLTLQPEFMGPDSVAASFTNMLEVLCEQFELYPDDSPAHSAVVFYDDGRQHDGSRPPSRGVQVIVQDHPEVGVELVTASDYYVLKDGRWHGVDIFGLYDFLQDSGIVLFGRTIERRAYQTIVKLAEHKKAGWLPHEVKPDEPERTDVHADL